MKHKPVFYFIFIFVFSCLAINSISFSAFAASVITKNEIPLAYSPTENNFNKRGFQPGHSTYKKIYSYSTSDFIDSTAIPPYSTFSENRPASNEATPLLSRHLINKGKSFLAENEDNSFVQDSLDIFYQTKQFLNETDLKLHNLTQNALTSLKLEHIIQKNKSSSFRNNNLSTIAYQKQYKNNQLHSNNEETFVLDFLRKVFNLQNLFYFIGVSIIFFTLIAIIKYTQLKKQRKQKYRNRRHRHKRSYSP